MAKRPRFGSLRFYPRKRAAKTIPSANWKTYKADAKNPGFLGFIAYKAGMTTALVKDSTDKSMTSGKKVAMPVTILETPNMKIFSVRFYNKGIVAKDIIVSSDKELRRVARVPKELKNFDAEAPKQFDDIRVVAYTLAKDTTVKKTPDMIELAINAPDKLAFVKQFIGKEISFKDFAKSHIVDIRGTTTGKGLSGPVDRFGITLKGHKSEKGVRRPGSLAPWHPARVTFRTPMAGQLGLFSRLHYNQPVITSNTIKDKDINLVQGFKNYGKILTSYVIIKGSVQGPVKRAVLLTPSFRPTKKAAKTKLEFLELLR